MARCERDGCRRGTFYGYNGKALGECFGCHGTGEVREFGTGRKAQAEAASARARGAMLQIDALPALPMRRLGVAPAVEAPGAVLARMGAGATRLRAAALVRRGAVPMVTVAAPGPEGPSLIAKLAAARAAGASEAEQYAIAFPEESGDAERYEADERVARSGKVGMSADEYAVRVAEAMPESVGLRELRNGYFTVVLGGEAGRVTLRVQADDWSGPDKAGVPGQQSVAYLNGPDNWSNYRSFVFVKGVEVRPMRSAPERALAALHFLQASGLDGMRGAAEAYALESSRCSRCHRMLTVPASIHAGLGPDCANKSEY